MVENNEYFRRVDCTLSRKKQEKSVQEKIVPVWKTER